MICNRCNERQATIEFTTVVGDEKKTQHLCPECSKQESESAKHGADQIKPDKASENDTQNDSAAKITPAHVSESKKVNVVIGQLSGSDAGKGPCTGCGMTYDEFRKIGRLGCARCYDAFGPPLRRLLKRIHGADTHSGRGPRPAVPTTTETTQDNPVTVPSELSDVDQQNVDALRAALQEAVDAEQYERAADLRDQITRLEESS